MLTYLFATLAAAANAASSVLQRKAHRDHPVSGTLSWELLAVLRTPVWLLGFLAVIAGFLLQAAALSFGPLSVVEPVLAIELPMTLFAAGVVFRRRLHGREWAAALAMTAGVSVLLYALAPTAHDGERVSALGWWVGLPVNIAVIVGLVLRARQASPVGGAALLGVATGAAFGLTVALMKTVTNALSAGGIASVLTTWQTYAMVASGLAAMFLLQSALNGSLVAAQPGFTIIDPVVSIMWGVLAYGETIRGGTYLVVALVAAVVVALGAYILARSPLVGGAAEQPSPRTSSAY